MQAVQIFAIMNVLMAKLCLYNFFIFWTWLMSVWEFVSVCVCDGENEKKEREGDLGCLHQEKAALIAITIKIIHVQLIFSVSLSPSLSISSLFFCLSLSC